MENDANTPFFDFINRVRAAGRSEPVRILTGAGSETLATELAIKRVDEANTPDPLAAAEANAIATLATLPSLVSSDTILPDLEKYGFSDNRAIGPLMRRLVRKGHIAPTGEYRKSKRPGSHGVPRAVYWNARAADACGQHGNFA